ncbi:hypothetical protein [Roseibium sp.]|uniref:hypothetical protein n=1 Tax=Roseibium sp. TaxID=1936156 RepID=UPI003A97EEA9
MTFLPYQNKGTALDANKFGAIIALKDRELLLRSRYQCLAQRSAAVPISSREFPNWMASVIFDFNDDILWPNGREFEVGDEDIDKAFNNDGSFRWIRSFRNRAHIPLKQIPHRNLIPRLRLIDLTFQIADRMELLP